MNSEDMNDAEFEAFLKGEDELSRRLKGLPQPSPSSELDAAILKRAQEQIPRTPAANDPGTGAQPVRPLGWRWRAPAGIAASVLACVLAHQAWQERTAAEQAAAVPAPAPVAAPAQADTLAPPPPPPPAPEMPPRLAAKSSPRSARVVAPVVEAVAAQAQVAEAPPTANQVAPAPAAPAPATPAPAPAPAVVSGQLSRAVTVTGRRSRVDAAGIASAPDPKAWLAAIDELLKAGLRRDSLEEWDKFRAAYPDYPVPAETAEKINALKN